MSSERKKSSFLRDNEALRDITESFWVRRRNFKQDYEFIRSKILSILNENECLRKGLTGLLPGEIMIGSDTQFRSLLGDIDPVKDLCDSSFEAHFYGYGGASKHQMRTGGSDTSGLVYALETDVDLFERIKQDIVSELTEELHNDVNLLKHIKSLIVDRVMERLNTDSDFMAEVKQAVRQRVDDNPK